jgi:hypothetical protein
MGERITNWPKAKNPIEQLRQYARWDRENGMASNRTHVCDWAADRIESLQTEIDCLRAKLNESDGQGENASPNGQN